LYPRSRPIVSRAAKIFRPIPRCRASDSTNIRFTSGDTGSELPNRSATDSSPVLTRNDEGEPVLLKIKREKFSSIDVAVEPIQLGPGMIAQK
jgi:hypothetical protein